MDFPFLSVIIFLPLVAALVIAFIKDEKLVTTRVIALISSLACFFCSIIVFLKFKPTADFQFVEQYNWIPAMGISYFLGVDGINLLLLLLANLIGPIVILASWHLGKIHYRGFLIALLLSQVGLSGTLVALDMILFFVFMEATLLPLFFLIGVWGRKGGTDASRKFIFYNVAGGAIMLLGILVLYFYNAGLTQTYSFNFLLLSKIEIPPAYQLELFLIFALGFAIMIPVFPFHLWFKNIFDTAPVAANVIVNAVFVKIGVYGFLRFCLPLFPSGAQQFTPLFLVLAIIGLLYGALSAIIEKKLTKLIASIAFSQIALVVLGIFSMNAQGVLGSLIHMVNHGLTIGLLVLMLGILYERKLFTEIESFGGLAKKIPIWTVFFGIACFSLIGVPGLSGFVGEFLVLLGVFEQNKFAAFCGVIGLILVAIYIIRLFMKLVLREALIESERIRDLSIREILVLAPLVVFIFLIGIYPNLLLSKIEPSVNYLVKIVETSGVGDSTIFK